MDGRGMIRTFGIVALLAAASVQCFQIHEQMTDDEIANLFHTTRDQVPEYDVVPVRHNLFKRSDPKLRLKFNAFGKKIDVHLEPTDGVLAGRNTPVWFAYTKPDGTVEYKKLRDDIVEIVAGFFNSPIDLSTVVVSRPKNDTPSFEGVVEGLAVRPLPERLQETMRSRRSVEDSNTSRTLSESRYHVVIKSPVNEEAERISELERQIHESTQSGNRTDDSRMKRFAGEIIYPSLLISTDFKGSKTTQNELAYYDEIMYQLAFWNGVDLRFRQVSDPKVRIRIAGIIIGQDRAATPYLHKVRSGDNVKVKDAWSDMQEYWHNMTKIPDFPRTAYDAVVTMTDYNLISENKGGSTGHMLGVAAMNSLCIRGLRQYYALAVVHDNGGFDGIITATHELGHILGLDHDKDSSDECDKSYGFIMQPSMKASPKNLRWSPCSLKSLSHFLRRLNDRCAAQPAEFHPPGLPVQRFLPGDVKDAHQQCQARGYAWACNPTPGMCSKMRCYYTNWNAFLYGWWCHHSLPAAEGTICAPGHKCVDGECQCLRKDCIFESEELTA